MRTGNVPGNDASNEETCVLGRSLGAADKESTTPERREIHV